MPAKEKIRITRLFNFEAAHALPWHSGKCSNIHGHSYVLEVCISGSVISSENEASDGMIMDFQELKQWVLKAVINDFDHSLLLFKSDLRFKEIIADSSQKVILFDSSPTCENILLDCLNRLRKMPPNEIELIGLKLRETATSKAEWNKSDQV